MPWRLRALIMYLVHLICYLRTLLSRDIIYAPICAPYSIAIWFPWEIEILRNQRQKLSFRRAMADVVAKYDIFLCRYWRLWSLFVSLLFKSWFIKSWFSGRQELVLKSWFSGRRFKSQSDQLSITVSNNPLGVNTIYIRSFRYTRVITSRKLQLK